MAIKGWKFRSVTEENMRTLLDTRTKDGVRVRVVYGFLPGRKEYDQFPLGMTDGRREWRLIGRVPGRYVWQDEKGFDYGILSIGRELRGQYRVYPDGRIVPHIPHRIADAMKKERIGLAGAIKRYEERSAALSRAHKRAKRAKSHKRAAKKGRRKTAKK